ncbi:SLBB domain-containing protein [Candidatus Omnitrophota bacterium]
MMKKIISITLLMFLVVGVSFSHSREKAFFDKISPGDILEISVYGESAAPTLSYQAPLVMRVSSGGTIKFPLLGEIKVSGLTEEKASRVLEKRLRKDGYMKNPQITVFISREGRAAKITVLGAVASPASIPVTGAISIVEAIAAAGGTMTAMGEDVRANLNHIRVLRIVGDEQKEFVLDVDVQGSTFFLQPDDIVIVDEYNTVLVQGDVVEPGTYRMRIGLRLADAITEAKGVMNNANVSRVRVLRTEDGAEKEYIVNLDTEGLQFLLQEYDRIYVEAWKFHVYGGVNAPGTYYISDGLSALDAIFVAGGLTDFADASTVRVVRYVEGKKKVLRVPAARIFRTGNKTKDVFLENGDVVIVSEGWLF